MMREDDITGLFFMALFCMVSNLGLLIWNVEQGARLSALETRVEYLEIVNENQIRD